MFDLAIFNALVVFATCFLWTFISILLRRRLINQEEFVKWQKELKEWNANRELARKIGDKKLSAKLKKKEKRIMQIQSKILKGQIITIVLNMALFMIVWQLLTMYIGTKDVAYLPFSIPFVIDEPGYPIPLFFWYLICSFFSSSILYRIFGINMGQRRD